MNEQRPHPNESNLDNRMTKKGLKEIEVTSYTNKCTFLFGGSILGIPNLSKSYLEIFLDACE